MNRQRFSPSTWVITSILLLLTILTVSLAVGIGSPTATARISEETASYLPIVYTAPPTPTPTPSPTPAPAPQWLSNIDLPGASCPNSVGINDHTGYIYVANTQSDNVSILQNNTFLKNVFTSRLPTFVESIPDTPYTYVTNLGDKGPGISQIAYFNGSDLQSMLPDYFEPVDVLYNPVNQLTYISDLDSTIRVFNRDQFVADIHIPDGGWLLTLAVDETTGYIYTAGWEKGMVHVIDGLEVIESFPAGWGTHHIAIDQERGFIYLAHSEPSVERPQNITVFHRDDRTLTSYATSSRSLWVSVDADGYAYYPNYASDSVTIVQGRNLIGTVVVGNKPRTAVSNQTTGYTLVTIEGANEVALFKSGTLLGTMPAGEEPWFVTTSEKSGEFWVANRSYYISCDDVQRCYEICKPATVSVYGTAE